MMERQEEILQADLEAASSSGDLNKIQALLSESKSSDIPSELLQSMVQLSARNSHPTTLSYLLSQGAYIDGRVVGAACTSNSTEIFQTLLDSGFDINECIGHAGDALVLCVGADQVPLVKWLLEHGADPNANRSGIRTTLDVAALHGSTEVARLLLQHNAQVKNMNSLKLAATHGRRDMILCLLEGGADINEIPDNEGMVDAEREAGLGTALHEAAKHGQAGSVSLLLERGADPNLKDSLGRTALECARLQGHDEVVDILGNAMSS